MKQGFFRDRIFPVIFMFVITTVCISVVSGIYLSTQEIVQLNETLVEKRGVLYAAGIPFPERDPAGTDAVFEKRVERMEPDGDTPPWFKIYDENRNLTGYAAYVSGPGVWGEIVAIFAFEEDLETMKGLEFVSQNETPGLGARITEGWFKEQFRGKKGPFVLRDEGTASEPNEIDAITGATGTSRSVRGIANRAAEEAASIAGRGR